MKKKSTEKYKKIAFQVTQTKALYNNMELYDKSQLYLQYPTMKPFLIRETPNLDDLTVFIKEYTKDILKFIGNAYGLTMFSNEFD